MKKNEKKELRLGFWRIVGIEETVLEGIEATIEPRFSVRDIQIGGHFPIKENRKTIREKCLICRSIGL